MAEDSPRLRFLFYQGQRKVGTALELPLARRAQLAVVAHIRHVYTDYDRLLKVTSFHEARTLVEEPTLAKLVEWRGDDENGKTVLEDVFREVIVISDDDDDSDSDEGENIPPRSNRDHSIELYQAEQGLLNCQQDQPHMQIQIRSDHCGNCPRMKHHQAFVLSHECLKRIRSIVGVSADIRPGTVLSTGIGIWHTELTRVSFRVAQLTRRDLTIL